MSINIKSVASGTLSQLADFITTMDNQHYTATSELLLGSSIGQHVRHILEFYSCLKEGYAIQKVNYDLRKRDLTIEQDKMVALSLIIDLIKWIDKAKPISLMLEGSYEADEKEIFSILSHMERELVYNIEHTIHHMAIVKIAAVNLYAYELPADFGVASSTLKYRSQYVYS
ncbi:MAG: DinB family protein [Chitinophagaceae bacterium]|nr:DinB family protein [Chitinophagaceae bacterium]